MAKKNHSLPFIVIALAVGMVAYEGYTDTELDVETLMPLLIAVGLGGAVKKTVEKAFAAKAALPQAAKEGIRAETNKFARSPPSSTT